VPLIRCADATTKLGSSIRHTIIGAVLQITAITQVVADVSDPVGVIAYAVGVGFGVLLLINLTVARRSPSGCILAAQRDPPQSAWQIAFLERAQVEQGEPGSEPVD
jgi:hypothetical protein